jgi:hypothetical protein
MIATADVFTHAHIGLTAGCTAAIVFAFATWRRDGISGYSANDWLAPVVTFVILTVYRDLFPRASPRRFGQLRALATITALVVNVITI